MVNPNARHDAKTTATHGHANESACTSDEQDEAALAALGIDAVRPTNLAKPRDDPV
jgi:hypothetical protein